MLDKLRSALSGRYSVERELGRGGMATVYLAQDLKHHRRVAIKVLSPEIARQIGAERFQREIQSAARLMHPHVLALHDSGDADGLLYYVMPYVEGESLRDRLRREVQLPVDDALRIAGQVADALDHAHRQGLVHRDIKPENILLSGVHAYVADFGVARVTGEAAGEAITQAGTAVGTPLYMSPEQASGAANQDGRTDQYALACVLYEMLTGQPPFTGATTQAILRQHISATVPSATTVRTSTPPQVEQALERALSKTPADRFATVGEFGRSISSMTSSSSVATSAATAAVPTPPHEQPPGATGGTPASASGDPFAAAASTPGRGTATGGAMPPGWTPHAQSTVTPGAPTPGVRRSVLGPAAIALVAVAIFIVIAWFVIQRPSDAPMGAAAASAQGSRLVVLPFDNLGSPDDEYFADGITEEITSRLSALDGIGVIARTSAMQYKDTEKPVQQIGTELGVQYILEGTVRWDKSGGESRVRVTPQLIRVADGTQVWANRYDAVLAEVFTVQTQIATEVTDALGGTLVGGASNVAQAPTENLDAYDAYLRAEAHMDRPNDETSVRKAIEQYEEAVRLDPDFAVAWAHLSLAHNTMQWYGHDMDPGWLRSAREAADTALEIDPDLVDGRLALGFLHYWGSRDYDRALQEFRGALERQPNDADMWGAVGAVYRRQGRWDEAVEAEVKAFELDPRSSQQAWETGLTFMIVRAYAEGERYANFGLALAPNSRELLSMKEWARWQQGDSTSSRAMLRRMVETLGWEATLGQAGPSGGRIWPDELPADAMDAVTDGSTWLPLGDYYAWRGEPQKARTCYRKAIEFHEPRYAQSRNPLIKGVMGRAHVGLGDVQRGVKLVEEAARELPRSRDAIYSTILQAMLADVYMMAGREDDALTVIEDLLAKPGFAGPRDYVDDPLYAPIVDHPRLRAAIENVYRWRPRS